MFEVNGLRTFLKFFETFMGEENRSGALFRAPRLTRSTLNAYSIHVNCTLTGERVYSLMNAYGCPFTWLKRCAASRSYGGGAVVIRPHPNGWLIRDNC